MTTTTLDLGAAQQAVDEARAAHSALVGRADAGDPGLKAGALAVAREELDLAERRLRAAQRRAADSQAAADAEQHAQAVRQLVEDHDAGRQKVAAALTTARSALRDLVVAAGDHNALVRSDLRAVANGGPTDRVNRLGEDSEFVAVADGRKIYLAHLDRMVAALALELRDQVFGPDSGAERAALQRAAEWHRGALIPFEEK